MLWWLLAGAGVLALLACVLLYNRLVKLGNRVDNAWSQVDVQLRRRYDLIPNLLATVKAYATHESETLGAVVRARDGARSAATVEEQGKAESALTGAIGRLLAVAEAYPELRSEERFAELQDGGQDLRLPPHLQRHHPQLQRRR
jgi:LemA protein